MIKYIFGIVALVGIVAAMDSFFVVDQTEQALILQMGKPVAVYKEPGLHFKYPLIEEAKFFDKRLMDFDANPKEVIAKGNKLVVLDAFVKYRIVNPLKFYQIVRDQRTMSNRLNSIVESSLLQVIEDVYLEELLSKQKEQIMEKIKQVVDEQTVQGNKDFGIEIVDVRIRRTNLPKENSEAIYRRMKTEREREAKEFRARGAEEAQKIRSIADKERTVLLAEAKKKAEILRGEGDATAIKIFADAFGQDTEFFDFYRSMQLYKNVLKKEDTKLIISPDAEFLKYLNE